VTGETSWYPPAQMQVQAQPPAPPAAPMPSMQRVGVMMFNFIPTGSNAQEIACYANDQIILYAVDADGWATGRNLRSGQLGLVPANYMRM